MKIYRKTAGHTGTLTVQDMGRGDATPIIALRGKWLLNSGFYPKDKVKVEANEGQIIITLAEKADPNRVMPHQRRDYIPPETKPSTGPAINIPMV